MKSFWQWGNYWRHATLFLLLRASNERERKELPTLSFRYRGKVEWNILTISMLSTMKEKCSELKASRCGKLFSSVAMTTQNEKKTTIKRTKIVSAYFFDFSSFPPSLPLLFRAQTHARSLCPSLSLCDVLFFRRVAFYKLSTFFCHQIRKQVLTLLLIIIIIVVFLDTQRISRSICLYWYRARRPDMAIRRQKDLDIYL